MNKQEVPIPVWLIERALQCLGRAEVEGAFRDCVAPDIGRRTAAALQDRLDNWRAAPK